MPDYDIIWWNFDKFPRGKSHWVDQAFSNHKFAFAADYIRLYALYHYGGIYLDSDVNVLKSFDDLLDLPYFVGQEKTPSGIEAATIGFPPKHPLIKQLLDRYEGRSFIKEDGSFDMEPMPYIIRRYIESQYTYNVISKKEDFSFDAKVFNVFTVDYFSPKRYDTGEIEITNNTYSVHNFAGSWLPQPEGSTHTPRSIISKIKVWIVRHILVRKCIVLLSGNREDSRLSQKFNIRHHGPLSKAVLSDSDFKSLINNKELFVEDNLRFICRDESKKETADGDFFPIALVGNTDIEVHFVDCYSREQALKSWNEGIRNMLLYKPVILYYRNSHTKLRDYWNCIKINLGQIIIL